MTEIYISSGIYKGCTTTGIYSSSSCRRTICHIYSVSYSRCYNIVIINISWCNRGAIGDYRGDRKWAYFTYFIRTTCAHSIRYIKVAIRIDSYR